MLTTPVKNMYSVFIDTNCYIRFLENKLPTFQQILNLQRSGKVEIFYQTQVKKELIEGKKLDKSELLERLKILSKNEYRGQPFTIGVSVIDGDDYISRFDNQGLRSLTDCIKKFMFPNKKLVALRNSDLVDIEILRHAINLGCDYFITENTNDFGKTGSKKRSLLESCCDSEPKCKIRTANEFLEEHKRN